MNSPASPWVQELLVLALAARLTEPSHDLFAGEVGPPGPPLEPYKIEHGITADGLPQSPINCLCQTRDGYLWIGMEHGLARFDGRRLTRYVREITVSKPGDTDCQELAEDSEGRLWIRTSEALISYLGGQFRRYAFRDAPLNGKVNAWCVRRKGGLWLIAGQELTHFESGVVTQRFGLHDGLISVWAIQHLREDLEGRLWLGSDSSWIGFDPRSRRFETLTDVVGSLRNTVADMMIDRAGRLWLASSPELLCWSNGAWSRYSVGECGPIVNMVEGRDGDLYFRRIQSQFAFRFHPDPHQMSCYLDPA